MSATRQATSAPRIRQIGDTRIYDFSIGPSWFRLTGSLVLNRGGKCIRRFAVARGYLYPSLKRRMP